MRGFEVSVFFDPDFVRAWNGENVTFYVLRWSTFGEVKEKLGIPVCRQRIVFSGKMLKDNLVLLACDVCKESTLHMVLLWH